MTITHSRVYCLLIVVASCLINAPVARGADPSNAAQQAVGFSAGWITGSGLTYRRYSGDNYLESTLFGIVSSSAKDAYVNVAFSMGHYFHRTQASGKVPPIGLKIIGGIDMVLDRRADETTAANNNQDMSYYGGGVALDIGNPGRAGLSLSIALNYVFAFEGIGAPDFQWFGARPAADIIYGW